MGIVLLIALTVFAAWPRPPWQRRTVLVGSAMIYVGYGLIYAARACMVKQFGWTEAQLIYLYAARYHVLPLLGLAAIFAALLAAWRPIRRCDHRPGIPAAMGCVAGLVMLAVQYHECSNPYLVFLLNQPDQKATMTALHHLGQVAREQGITKDQLLRIMSPALRAWNQSVLDDRPSAFPMMKLVDAPEVVTFPLDDDRALSLLRESLKEVDRIALGTGACASINPPMAKATLETLSVGRPIRFDRVQHDERGRLSKRACSRSGVLRI